VIDAVKDEEITWFYHKNFNENGSTLLTIMSVSNDLR